MKIAAITEKSPNETRVAISPETAKALIGLGCHVIVEHGAGESSSFSDDAYQSAGVTLKDDAVSVAKAADILLTVSPPAQAVISALKKDSILIGMLAHAKLKSQLPHYAKHTHATFSMEFLPRISRAQSMDVLSSQSNLAGYKAVIDAVSYYGRVIPMMTTAAGSIKPAKVLVLGAGVAGLQAIATAKRLGAVVSAFDVRPDAKEQVQSLGATFIEVASSETATAQTAGGYAKEMSADYKQKQSLLIHETLKTQDIVICTALIPGKPAPTLITEAMVQDMPSGSVIVDLAAATGGNCALTQKGKVAKIYGTTIIGYQNMPGRVAEDASRLYAKNLFQFVKLLIHPDKKLQIDRTDDLIKHTLLTFEGNVVHPLFKTES